MRQATFTMANTKRTQRQAKDPFESDDDERTPIERDITTTRILPPAQFRSENFARMNIDAIGEYADYRVIGWNAEKAFTRVFGTDYADIYLFARIEALEHNLVYRKLFASKFGQIELNEMWDAKISTYEMLSIINNPFTKCSTRLAAIKDLNVLFGIVIADPNGAQRPGSGWTDFYKDAQGSARVTQEKHPEPGSPEAEARLSGSARRESTGYSD